MNEKQRRALCLVLNRIGSWSNARFDQWLRYEVGDADADEILNWFDREAQIEFSKDERRLFTRNEIDALGRSRR